MQTRQPPKFNVGDRVVFLGSERSRYGRNSKSDKYIGDVVTVKERHPTGYPYAYTFKEFGHEYFFSEDCFEFVVFDLPEFEVNTSITDLF